MSFQFPSMESGHRHRKSKCRTGSAPFLRRQPEAWGLHLHCLLTPQPPSACEGRGPAQEEKMRLSLRLIHLAQAQDPGQICSTSSPISSMKMGGGGLESPPFERSDNFLTGTPGHWYSCISNESHYSVGSVPSAVVF